MALEATHIRFALDLKDKYKVQDIKAYVSGAIYPDSRYVSGIDRLLTHPVDYLDWHWESASDFKKGWLAHLLADKVQWQITKEWLPQVFEGEIGPGSETWVKHTSLKILQDLDDVRKFNIAEYLSYLEHVENPNGEDIEKVKQYNQIFPKMYANPANVNIDRCYEMWKQFGIGDELAMKVKQQAEEYSNVQQIMEKVLQIYPEMLKRAQNI